MNKAIKALCISLTFLLIVTLAAPCVYAKKFAPVIDATNIGVKTQYLYEENDPSWIRKLTVKEDMLSSSGLMNAEILYPVSDYPYTTDAENFKATVEENVELYTLDEDSQRAAYLYMLEQVGALSVLTEPDTSGATKADWLRNQGIIVTAEDEQDPDKILMISALYAMMKNDLYYVYTGKTLVIPRGTPLEEAVVMYLSALSGNNDTLTAFVQKFFGTASLGNLEDYIYYTSLMTLFTAGYVTPAEIPNLSREEVYRRIAIMTIRNAGISIDAETATMQEVQQKYLTAMLGTRYSVTLDTDTLIYSQKKGKIPYYILQKMGAEDCNLTISEKKYTYEECFTMVCEKTQRFDLDNEFYCDIREYNIYLDHLRSNISINPTPISSTGTTIYIDGTKVSNGSYAVVPLTGEATQTIKIVSDNVTNGIVKSTTYRLNIHQGDTVGPDSDLTGLIPSIGDINNSGTTQPGASNTVTLPPLTPGMSNVNDAVAPLLNNVLTFNENGQLVDGQGNVVSDSTYETLPDGFQYVLDADGLVTIVPIGQTTTESATDSQGSDPDKTNKIVIIVSATVIVLLICAIPLVLYFSKNGKPDAEKMRKRKQREKAKRDKKLNKSK